MPPEPAPSTAGTWPGRFEPRSHRWAAHRPLSTGFDHHQVVLVVVAEEEQKGHGAVASHQVLVDVDSLRLQLGVVSAWSDDSNAIPVIRPG